MAHLNLKTSKSAETKKSPRCIIALRAPASRRCGPECNCSDEELDAGGPA